MRTKLKNIGLIAAGLATGVFATLQFSAAAQQQATTPLPLTQGINPAWAEAIAALQTHAITPLLGARTVLTEADWNALLGKLAAFEAWNAGKTGGAMEKIGLQRAREILGTKAKETLTALIAKDKAEEGNSLAEMLKEDLIAERIAIETYREITHYFGDKDPTSRRLIEEILAVEEEHADELADLLFAIKPDGAPPRRLYFNDEVAAATERH